jgi:hypothetical protein
MVLKFDGGHIIGDYYETDAYKKFKTNKKNFIHVTYKLAHELDIKENFTNEEIFQIVLQYIENCKKELNKKRFVDDTEIKEFGKFLNWKYFRNSK